MNNDTTISSSGTNGEIYVTADTTQYWSQKSKDWAISGELVDREDYSSKYYAQKSKESAQKAEQTKEEAITDIQTQENTSLTEIQTATQNGKNEMQSIYEQFQEQVDSEALAFNNPFFFGLSAYFENEPNNLSWLKSEGQRNSKALYSDYYNWILENANNNVEGFKVSTATDITDYDFVINTTDETFRLPLKNNSADDAQAAGLNLYFYIGETVQNANLIDAGKLAEEVATVKANKADKSPWVSVGRHFLISVDTRIDSTGINFSLKDILPNDGNTYECLCYITASNKANTSANIMIMLTTSYQSISRICTVSADDSKYAVGMCAQFTALIGTNREMKIQEQNAGVITTVTHLALLAYRRID